MQVQRGCNAPAPIPVFMLDHEPFYRCPLRVITRETVELIRYHRFFEQGHLPATGGMLDQSATFLEAMDVISAERAWAQEPKKN